MSWRADHEPATTPVPSSKATPLVQEEVRVGEDAGQTVIVAVGQPLTRGTLVDALRRRGFHAVPGATGTGNQVAEACAHPVGTIIIDDSVEADELRSRLPDVRLLVLDTVARDHRPDPDVVPTDRTERVPPHVSLDDLTAVLRGERTTAEVAARRQPAVRSTETARPPTSELTPREQEVLRELMSGATSAMIAAHLGISGHTVRTHVQNIFGKLGVHTRLEAVAVALRAGLRPAPGRVQRSAGQEAS